MKTDKPISSKTAAETLEIPISSLLKGQRGTHVLTRTPESDAPRARLLFSRDEVMKFKRAREQRLEAAKYGKKS